MLKRRESNEVWSDGSKSMQVLHVLCVKVPLKSFFFISVTTFCFLFMVWAPNCSIMHHVFIIIRKLLKINEINCWHRIGSSSDYAIDINYEFHGNKQEKKRFRNNQFQIHFVIITKIKISFKADIIYYSNHVSWFDY